jgi:hypothetical protein
VNDLNKIPFGLRETDQQYVDIADVNNGKKCGCICPSCKMPLQAKQGRTNQWHFAHSSRGTSNLTQNQCEFSFWVSVLSMAKEIIRQGGTLTVPSYTKYLGYDEIVISDKKTVDLTDPEIEKSCFDILCNFGKYSIGIYFTSPEKKYRQTHLSDKNTGILEISISNAFKTFFSKDRSSDYKSILSEIIFKDIGNKHWIYHPKIESYNRRYGERLKDKPPHDESAILSGMAHKKPSYYQCQHCKIKWRGIQECPDCHNKANQVELSK